MRKGSNSEELVKNQPVDLELQPCPEKVSRLVGPAVSIPSVFEKCYEKKRCGVLWEIAL